MRSTLFTKFQFPFFKLKRCNRYHRACPATALVACVSQSFEQMGDRSGIGAKNVVWMNVQTDSARAMVLHKFQNVINLWLIGPTAPLRTLRATRQSLAVCAALTPLLSQCPRHTLQKPKQSHCQYSLTNSSSAATLNTLYQPQYQLGKRLFPYIIAITARCSYEHLCCNISVVLKISMGLHWRQSAG